jgi:hypothetical protein
MTVTRFAPRPRLSSCRQPAHGAVQPPDRAQGRRHLHPAARRHRPGALQAEYADAIQEDLEWLGLTWDRIERQSARLDRYAEAADELRDMGRFYEAFETPTELDLKRKKQLNMGQAAGL